MKFENKKKLDDIEIMLIVMVFIIVFVSLIAGCSNKSVDKRCVESHTENDTCISPTITYGSNGQMMTSYTYYTCTKTVCDKYETIEN